MISTMKKYIPIFIAIFGLSFYLVSQGVFRFGDPTASPSSKIDKLHGHYEKVLKKFSGKSIEGETLPTDGIPKVLILNFWASWCTPCLEEFPSLVSFTEKYKDKSVQVIGINTDEKEDLAEVKKTIKKYKLNFPNILDSKGKYINDFVVNAIPVSLIFHQGKIVEVSQGSKDFMAGEFIENVEKWLK